jgi:hypothetical protein
LNCWTHAGLHVCALIGLVHFGTVVGKANLLLPVGFAAKGTPRNLLTVAGADGREVVVPMIGPESRVIVGLAEASNAKCRAQNAWKIRMMAKR